MKNRRLLVTILFFSLLIGCFQKQKGLQADHAEAPDQGIAAIFLMVNHLTGWEITNFGPQGPVFISGDQIVLGMGDGCTGITWKKEFPLSTMRSLSKQRG